MYNTNPTNNFFNTNLNSNNFNQPIANPFGNPRIYNPSLCLNQIEGFLPIDKFIDDSNIEWQLVKRSSDSTVDIPDPKTLQIVDYWNHEFPNIKSKLYVYVVEGIRQPRIETEQPSRLLYQWFSTVFIPTFTPQMISDREWLKANVYAAPISNSRISKLKAICHIEGDMPSNKQKDKLIEVEELNGSNQ